MSKESASNFIINKLGDNRLCSASGFWYGSKSIEVGILTSTLMQEYSDQENARLKAVVSKQEELIDEMLHGNVHNIDHWNKQGKLLSELEKLNDRD